MMKTNKEEYIIVNKTALEKMREVLNEGSAHWDGVYLSDYQQGQIDLIDVIIMSQSTPLIPEIEKAYDAAKEGWNQQKEHSHGFYVGKFKGNKQDYISNLILDI